MKTKICPHCGTESEEIFELDDYEIWRCKSCSNIILSIGVAMDIVES